MERRHFLKLAFGFAAGGIALAASAQAAPLMPAPLADDTKLPVNPDAQPAVTSRRKRFKDKHFRSRSDSNRHMIPQPITASGFFSER